MATLNRLEIFIFPLHCSILEPENVNIINGMKAEYIRKYDVESCLISILPPSHPGRTPLIEIPITAIITLNVPRNVQLCLSTERALLKSLAPIDRKSTRLNSSHQIISYAVFC